MLAEVAAADVVALAGRLTFKARVERSLFLLEAGHRRFGDGLVVANSLGKDSVAVWHLAKRVSPSIRGFVVTTRFKPPQTVAFMRDQVARFPELRVYASRAPIPERLYETDPDRCCEVLKVEPTRRAVQEMGATCWATGLRCTEGRTRVEFREVEERDAGLVKLNPILLWHEREVWQYLALWRVDVNPLYAEGYRSLGCAPCARISADSGERAGRWSGTSKCGGECGIHTRPLGPGASGP
jgi:phosphoadenosine phosphosulfate reductase